MTDYRPWDRRTLDITKSIVDQVEAKHLDLPTPCAAWTLRQLLSHMIGQNHGFAAAADGEREDRTVWADREFGDDPAGVFRASADRVTTAFAREGVLDGGFWLPEVRPEPIPAGIAVSFHFVDYVVHGWDVAAALGVAAPFPDDLLRTVLPIAETVPDTESRLQPGASFAPGLPVAGDGLLDRVLSLLGRSPGWQA